VTEPIHEAGLEMLRRSGAEVELLYETGRPLEDAAREADAVIVRVWRITRRVLEEGARGRLRLVVKHGTGVDNIDVEAARELGIAVENVPAVHTDAVAEQTIGLMLLLAKRFIFYDSQVRAGNWAIRYSTSTTELRGKTLGIVGVGRIGSTVAKIAGTLGMRVLGFDPYVKAAEGVELTSLENLMRESDFITIHVPLNEETRHMIGRRQLALMNRAAYLVNAARGGVVDEEALVDTLREGRIAGAALDTTEQEPLPLTSPLLQCPNLVLTAHTAAHTQEALRRLSEGSAEKALKALKPSA